MSVAQESKLVILTLLFVLTGCAKVVSVATPGVSDSLSISPSSITLIQGTPSQLSAVLTSGNSTSQDVTQQATWQTSSDALSVGHGTALCGKVGKYTLTAALNGQTSSASVTCKTITKQSTSMSIVNPTAIIRSNAPYQFIPSVTYSDGTTDNGNGGVTWSGTSTVARIAVDGTVFCNTSGVGTLTASMGTVTSTSSFTCILAQVTPSAGFSEHSVQFDGPFPSYIDVKVAFGAKGDGVHDDTVALQNAVNAISSQGKVMWLPRGNYLISQTLHVVMTQAFTIIGEDPKATTFTWIGAKGGTMISFDGSTGFRMDRLGWNGQNSAGVAIHVGSTLQNGQFYPTFDALEDQQIDNVAIGIQLGFAGETTINRVHFDHNSTAGVRLEDFNALNFNVIDSLFTDCSVGITNDPGAGAYNVSNSVFVRSTVADMVMGNTGPFSIKQNISSGSQAFFVALGSGAAPTVTLQANVVSGTHGIPVQVGDPGPIMLIDNSFQDLDPSQPILLANGANPTGVFSMGNNFSALSPIQGNTGIVTSLDEAPYNSAPAINITVPADVFIPQPSGRPVFEVQAGDGSDKIQAVIDQAAANNGGAVIHLPAGGYQISQTINIPDVPNLVLLGDGSGSQLVGTSQLSGPIVSIRGSASLDALSLNAGGGAQALAIQSADEPSTVVSCDLCYSIQSQNAVQISGFDNATVAFRISALNGVTTIQGGPNQVKGIRTLGHVDAFMTSSDFYTVANGGHFMIQDGWHDGGQGPNQFLISDNSVLTHQGGAINTGTGPALQGAHFSGSIALLGTSLNASVQLDGQSDAQVAVVGSIQRDGSEPLLAQSSDSVLTDATDYTLSGGPLAAIPTTGATTALEGAFAQTRTDYVTPRLMSTSSATVVRLHRLLTIGGSTGIQIEPDASTQMQTIKYSLASSQAIVNAGQATCSLGTYNVQDIWSLQDGGDGFYGLRNSEGFLSQVPGKAGNNSLNTVAVMTDAGQRWLIRPIGDGMVKVVSRADGRVLARGLNACSSLADDADDPAQEWLITKSH